MKKLSLLVLVSVLGCSDFQHQNKRFTRPDTAQKPEYAGSVPDPQTAPFTREKMLTNIGLTVVLPTLKDMAYQTEHLSRRLQQQCREAGLEQAASASEVQTAWREAMLTWQKLKAYEFGPVMARNGEESQNIYSWPFVNTCGVDTVVVDVRKNGQPTRRLNFSSRGLAALEYLLFDKSYQTECRRSASPEVYEWMKLGEDEKKRDRCRAAQILADDLNSRVQGLVREWDPDSGHYTRTLLGATPRDAVHMVSDTLFYVEKVKDRKLAVPLGMTGECRGDDCLELVEHGLSDIGLHAVQANLQGLAQVLLGQYDPEVPSAGKDYGFDDYLEAMNRQDLAEKLRGLVSQVLQTARSVARKGSYKQQLQQAKQAGCGDLCVLQQQVQLLNRFLKSDLLSALDLRPPRTIEGDND